MEISHALTEMALQINPVAYFVVLQDLGEHLNKISIKNQVLNGLNSIKSQRANKFIVYFQNFTNTYDTIENLKDKYDSALVDKRIVGLSIATRPDCINENICKLLKTYTDKYYVSVELGLQTSNDYIGTLINRRYSTKQFIEATKLLNKYMKTLTKREKQILEYRYGLNGNDELTQKEIASKMGISRSYVSRIEKRATTKILREFMKNNQRIE